MDDDNLPAEILLNGIPLSKMSATIELKPEDEKAFNDFIISISEKNRQKDLKEKIMSKYLMKLVRKEIDKIETCNKIIMIHPYEENFLMIIDKSKFKKIGDYIPLTIDNT
jgi:hypothetical protein